MIQYYAVIAYMIELHKHILSAFFFFFFFFLWLFFYFWNNNITNVGWQHKYQERREKN